jgi:hypothetical protein
MKNKSVYERPAQIQLGLPDYRYDYEQWLKKKQNEEQEDKKETVIVLDIY